MAKFNSIFNFTGKLGNVIAYRRGGKVCLRTRPETVRQTDNTRRSAKWFGAASNKGAFIRNVFAEELDIPHYGAHVNQLNKTIFKAGRNNHAALKGFRFNPSTRVDKFFPSRSELSRDGKLQIHANSLDALGGAIAIEVKLIAKRIDFTTRKVTGTDVAFMVIGKDYLRKLNEQSARLDFKGAELSVNVPGKGTLIVVMQVRLHLEDGASCNKKLCAADIIAVQEDKPLAAVPAKSHPHKQLPGIPTGLSDRIPYAADKVVIIQRE